MTLLEPDFRALPAAQRRIWPSLAPATSLDFVLYGGTAIALRLGHRTSIDFDFFTEQPLDHAAVRTSHTFFDQATVLQEGPNTLTVLVPDSVEPSSNVKLSYFGGIDIGRVGRPQVTSDSVLQVASIPDLMATKLKVMLQRAEAKDYTDVAAMLNSGASLAHGLASARVMYGTSFQPSESLKALIWFEDGDLDQLSTSDREVLTQAVRGVNTLPEVEISSTRLALP